MKKIIFTSSGVINGKTYKEGERLNVSSSIFTDLTEVQKCAKEYVKKTKKEY